MTEIQEMLREIEANRILHAVIIDTMIRETDALNSALEKKLLLSKEVYGGEAQLRGAWRK